MRKFISTKYLTIILSLVYFTSYVTRLNLSAIVQEVINSTGYSKTSFSFVLVALSITYGVGQVVNGIIGDKVKPQLVILIGLTFATITNFIFPFFSFSITILTILWAINGFAQAMMWPPLVRIMVNTFDEETYNKVVIKVINSAYVGTILIYLVSPLIISILNWKFVFFFSSICGVLALIIWSITYNKINITSKEEKEINKSFSFPKEALFPIAFIIVAIILQGMLREGITTWTPSYLVEIFNYSEETSIFFTVALAILSIVATLIIGYIYRKFINNEVMLAACVFSLGVILLFVLYFTYDLNSILSISLIAIIMGCIHGVNLCLISFVPKRFKKYGNISTISGVINSFTYVGAALSTYGIALLIENTGWEFTILSWLIIALIGTLMVIIPFKPWKKFYSK